MSMMTFKGNIREIAGKLKQMFASLTDDTVLYVNGREEEYLGKMQKNMGKPITKIRKDLWSKKFD